MYKPVCLMVALALASPEATADGIFLNAKGQAEAARIEGLIRPARLERAGAKVFVRGRIVDAHAIPRGYVVQFQPSWMVGTRQVWAREAVALESDVIQALGIEVDSHLDLQLLLSSRDEGNPAAPAAQRVRAPIGSPAWHARLARILNPAGPTEPPAETVALAHRGWVMYALIEEPSPVYPTDAAGQAAYKRYLEAAQARFIAQVKAGGADLLNPRSRSGSGADAMQGLVYGAARARRYSWDDKDDLTLDKATLQQPRGPGEGKDLMARAMIAASFLCRLADTPETGARQRCPAGQPCVAEPLLSPTGQRIAYFGMDARGRLLSIIEAAAPGVPDVNAMFEPSALPLEPAESALMALRVLEDCRPTWGHGAERFVRMLIGFAGEPPASAKKAQLALRDETRRTLMASLRPDLSRLREPELSRRRADAAEARQVFAGFLSSEDPALRAAAWSLIFDGGTVHDFIDEGAVDDLFGIAMNPETPEGGDGPEPQRTTRRYAVTLLMALGTLADPKHPTTVGSHPLARQILERIRRIRASKAAGTASAGESRLLDTIRRRLGEDDAEVGRHLKRFAALLGS
jgi:hypothetical protein